MTTVAVSPSDLAERVRLHGLYLAGQPGGVRLVLREAALADANLYGADLTDADFTRANLTGANLTDANLTDADLTRANLYYANFAKADLSRAHLAIADLSRANLRQAYLYSAILTGADLYRANLYRATLEGANLRDANLRDADLTGVNFADANLEGVVGVVWWQGGAYGPRRRMIRVVRLPRTPSIVMAGCLVGTADEITARLAIERLPVWVDEIGQEAADAALAEAVALIDLGVQHVEGRI